jgi:hypothetical protein
MRHIKEAKIATYETRTAKATTQNSDVEEEEEEIFETFMVLEDCQHTPIVRRLEYEALQAKRRKAYFWWGITNEKTRSAHNTIVIDCCRKAFSCLTS